MPVVQCLTEDGSELTRVSVVDAKGKRIYDSLVKPDKPILDYLTRCVVPVRAGGPKADSLRRRYSGLTKETLAGVTTRLADIQVKLAEMIDYNTILLGHSLECDLRVLKVRSYPLPFVPPLTPARSSSTPLSSTPRSSTSTLADLPSRPRSSGSRRSGSRRRFRLPSPGLPQSEVTIRRRMHERASSCSTSRCRKVRSLPVLPFSSLELTRLSRSWIRRVCQRPGDDL